MGAETLSTWMFRQEQAGHMDADLAVIINSIAVACKRISNLVATAPIRGLVGLADSTNESGDEQKKLDVISNDIFCDAMRSSARSAVIVTEEEDVPVGVADAIGGYLVSFDPIDGSSNIDAAVPTGSIARARVPPGAPTSARWIPGRRRRRPGEVRFERAQDGRAAGVRGVRVVLVLDASMMLTVGSGVYGFTLDWNTGEFTLSHEDLKIPETNGEAVDGQPGQRRQVGAGDARVRRTPPSPASRTTVTAKGQHHCVPVHRCAGGRFPPHACSAW